MSKFRIYTAAYTYTSTAVAMVATKYRLIKFAGSIWERTDNVFDDESAALNAAAEQEGKWDVMAEPGPQRSSQRTASAIFSDRQEAMQWLDCQRERVDNDDTASKFDWTLDCHTFDADDMNDFAYSPSYEVVLEVKQIKHLRVTIDEDHSEYDDIDDEFDAGEVARTMFENGDLDHEFEYEAEEWDTDVDIYSTSEE